MIAQSGSNGFLHSNILGQSSKSGIPSTTTTSLKFVLVQAWKNPDVLALAVFDVLLASLPRDNLR